MFFRAAMGVADGEHGSVGDGEHDGWELIFRGFLYDFLSYSTISVAFLGYRIFLVWFRHK